MEHWRRNPVVFWVTSLPPTLWLVVFFLIPLGIIWVLSFGEKRGIVDIEITWVLDNYRRAFDPLYLQIFVKSLWMATATTAVCLVVGFPVAFVITFATPRWKPVLLLLIILPFWTNLLIRTYALIAVLRTKGIVNFTLEWFWDQGNGVLNLVGLGELQLLGASFEPLQLLYNNTAVVVGLVYVHLPFMVLPLYASLDRMDRSYIEASLDLGAGQIQTLLRVTIPLALPGIASGGLLVFILCSGTFLTPDLLGGTDSEMIGNLIARQFGSSRDWPFGAALSFLLLYAIFAILWARASLAGRSKGVDVT
jgi:spermidine/putrescine transport system permease protein